MSDDTATTPFASVEAIDNTLVKYAVQILLTGIPAENDIVTANSASGRSENDIAAELVNTSNSPKLVALREKVSQLHEAMLKEAANEAKDVKANAGQPDLNAEKSATDLVSGLFKALDAMKDANGAPYRARVEALLPTRVKTTTRTTGATPTNSGPKSDQNELREWAKANGYPVGERGRIKDEILQAYNNRSAA